MHHNIKNGAMGGKGTTFFLLMQIKFQKLW